MSSLQHGSQPAPASHIPRFLWRVESRSSRYRVLECSHWDSQHVHFNRDELRPWISTHMESRRAYYHAPFVITSLTGSLLWALNSAHRMLSRGEAEVNIVPLEAWSALTDHIYPAKSLAAWLEIEPPGITWHDDP
ncbi:uncharacterized protein C8A04DRAFT_33377 [Dichotomopilus funicola]|uniref:DUF7587 domain-containing protein n=1 Tax=Dichotomopilus funicola TaxID=1934379 RepID=A0AAN6UUF4_9PEZI|nr:hypothetical protein C8A04DRAFT_33377 [Dichotomopilus funicola]